MSYSRLHPHGSFFWMEVWPLPFPVSLPSWKCENLFCSLPLPSLSLSLNVPRCDLILQLQCCVGWLFGFVPWSNYIGSCGYKSRFAVKRVWSKWKHRQKDCGDLVCALNTLLLVKTCAFFFVQHKIWVAFCLRSCKYLSRHWIFMSHDPPSFSSKKILC